MTTARSRVIASCITAACLLTACGVVSTVTPSTPKSPEAHRGQGQQLSDEALFQKAQRLQAQAATLRAVNVKLGRPGASQEVNDLMQRSRIAYRDLIKNYPTSRRIPEVYLAFADYYFDDAAVDTALQFYKRVAQYPDSTVYGYALYKSAWCHRNLQDDTEALSLFVQVIQHAKSSPHQPADNNLAKQARRDLVSVYARVGSPSRAEAFFKRISGGQDRAMLERLASTYDDNGSFAEARTIYQLLIARNASSDRLCHYQVHAARSTRRFEPPPAITRELRRTVDLMNLFSTGNHSAGVITACRQNTATLVAETATRWHRESMAIRDRETMRRSVQLYDALLSSFPDLDQLQLEGFSASERPTRARVQHWHDELVQMIGGSN